MFSYLTGELVRPRQDDLLATAQYQRLVREAGAGRPHRVRHEAASVAPELPCALSPC
jgi:histone H3/H4